jgi:hypothetical protein
MQGYRAASVPTVDVQLGPLPLGVLHLIWPVLVLFVALAIAGCTVSAAIRGPTPGSLRCSRVVDTVTCEEWRGDPMQLIQRISGPTQSVRFLHLGGHSSKDCVEIGKRIACGGEAKANVARISALLPGQRVDFDITDHSPTLAIAGGGFAFLFFLLAVTLFAGAFARRSVLTIRVGPTSLEVLDKKGGTLHTLLRGRGEMVRVVQVRAQRGEFPKWEIAYGFTEPITAITAFRANELELEPFAAKLREALATVPR